VTNPISVLCPVEFSDASRVALCYAAAIADHFRAQLTVLAVDDPLLAEVAAVTGRVTSLRSETERELRKFIAETLPASPGPGKPIDVRVDTGKPAPQILQAAKDVAAELIVMSSQGRSGARKMFFGSTTERVLRETAVPVLVTRGNQMKAVSLKDVRENNHRILAPVDLTLSSPRQVAIAAAIANALSMPLMLAHILEPVFVPPRVRDVVPGSDAARREYAEQQLSALVPSAASTPVVETLVVSGEPSEEIVKMAATRNAGLIVMGLHSSELFGPRMGSVTYRILCLTHGLVLALPPHAVRSAEPTAATALAHVLL
jgi:nucleotide-binding universal stress UspA family protein